MTKEHKALLYILLTCQSNRLTHDDAVKVIEKGAECYADNPYIDKPTTLETKPSSTPDPFKRSPV